MNTRRMNYVRAPHCVQNGPWTGAPQALQKLRSGAGGGISSAGGADGTDSTVPSDAQAVAAADDVSDAHAVDRYYCTQYLDFRRRRLRYYF